MEFISSRPDIVRSDSQRSLLSFWNRQRAAAALPVWHGLDFPAEIAAMTSDLSFADLVEADGVARLLIRFQGKAVIEGLAGLGVGKFLDEILPSPYREAALVTCDEVIATRLPVYTVSDMRDRGGRIVHFERLLLPFGRDGKTVDRILASLETMSPEGTFEHRDLMKAPPKLPAFALCTTIRH